MALRGFGLIKLLCAAASGRRTKRKAKFITRELDRVGQQLGMAQSAANSAEPIETLHGGPRSLAFFFVVRFFFS